jgi:hypothetical protein
VNALRTEKQEAWPAHWHVSPAVNFVQSKDHTRRRDLSSPKLTTPSNESYKPPSRLIVLGAPSRTNGVSIDESIFGVPAGRHQTTAGVDQQNF